jgi:hypothetical protein
MMASWYLIMVVLQEAVQYQVEKKSGGNVPGVWFGVRTGIGSLLLILIIPLFFL